MTIKADSIQPKNRLSFIDTNGNEGLDWADYPVPITPKQYETFLNPNRVLAVLKGTWLAPSEMAGLQSNKTKLHPVILKINHAFYKAKTEYELALAKAESEDIKIINELEKPSVKKYTVKKEKESWGFWGLIIMVFYPLHFVALQNVEPIEVTHLCPKTSKSEIDKLGSVHRFRWLLHVDSLEFKRYQEIKIELEKGIVPVLDNIKKVGARNLLSVEFLRQAHQLSSIYAAIFPNVKQEDMEAARNVLNTLPEAVKKLVSG